MSKTDDETEREFAFEVGHCALTLERGDTRWGSDYVRGDHRWSARLTISDRSSREKPLQLMVEMRDRLGVDSLGGWLRAMILEAKSIAHLMLLEVPGAMRGREDSLALSLIDSLMALTNQVGKALEEERKRAAERIRW